MPIEDGCATEKDAVKAKWLEAEEICNLAVQALYDWVEAHFQGWNECQWLQNLGGGMSDLLDHMSEEERERFMAPLLQDVENCINDLPEVMDAWSLYLDLEAQCEIERDETRALQDEFDACEHALHEGIPFA